MSDKTDIKSMTLPELEVFTTEVMGEKKFRAKQIYEWMHVRLADSFDEMTNLSKDLRQKLSEQCVLTHLEMVEKYVSAIDGTAKYLFKLSDDRIIESVLMHYKHGMLLKFLLYYMYWQSALVHDVSHHSLHAVKSPA